MTEQRQARRRRREERMRQQEVEKTATEPGLATRASDWARDHWIQIAGGTFIVLLVAILAIAVSQSGGESLTQSEQANAAETNDSTDLPGEFHPSEGRQHVNEDVDYGTTPPASGPHNPVPLPAGVYRDPGSAPDERAVHSMEHAAVVIWYNCEAGGLSDADCTAMVDEMRDTYEEYLRGQGGGGIVIINYPQGEHVVSVTAWTRLLNLDEYDPGAIEEFVDVHRCRFDPEGFC
ncbi:MAG: DUF3105 domain-containing protein [Dehalococcoidia bacterium]|nr:DUF3105 domain-containing protein [Dehalococcoidia bacterium]